ncbi:MAG: hypothetical protein V4858_16875 [Pseudomonadota bacterium]
MNIRNALVLGVSILGLLLTACASNTANLPPFPAEALPPPNLQSDGKKSGLVTVRVIVQFKTTTQAFDDDAFVTSLQVHAGALMHYIAAVSADTHVYGLELPAAQDPAVAMQRLRDLPSVARVEMDNKVKTN